MSDNDQAILDLFEVVLDPKSTDEEADAAMDEIVKLQDEEGLPPKEERPGDEEETCALLVSQKEETSMHELLYFLKTYYKSIRVAKLVAQHPSLDSGWLARFMHYLPEDAQVNPKYDYYSSLENWQKTLDSYLPKEAKCKYEWTNDDITTPYVSVTRPPVFKVLYWLNNGKAADKRFVVGIEKVGEKLVTPLAEDKSAHVRKAIASRAKISVELAKVMLVDKAKTVRQALADNPDCPPEVLTLLSQDADKKVSQAAMKNEACPDDAIHAAKLAEKLKPKPAAKPINKLTDLEIITQLADQTITVETLKKLADSPQNYVRAGVALHQNCSTDILTKLAKDSSQMVKLSVAFNPNTPVVVLTKMLKSKDDYLYLGLASNPSLPEQQQLDLIDLTGDDLRKVLADTTELESVWSALRDSKPTEKAKANSKKKTWRDCLTICLDPKGKGLYAVQRGTGTRYHFVNKLVARHPKCPEKLKPFYAFYLFSSLVKNPSAAMILLENPNAIKAEEYAGWKIDNWMMYAEAPGHVVKHYLHSDNIKYARKSVVCWTAQIVDIQSQIFVGDIHMKKYMAGLKNGTQFMFEILARDVKEPVRTAVVSNPNCPAEVLATLAIDKVASIRISAQNHKNFNNKLAATLVKKIKPESLKNKGPKRTRIKQAKDTSSLKILRDLAGDKVADVRLSVVNNRRTPLDVLEMLKDDPEEEIRRLACYHDNASVGLSRDLFKDPKEKVRYQALSSYLYATAKKLNKNDSYNRKYDETALELFYDDESELVRRLVASKTTNVEIQKRYALEQNQAVSKSLAYNFQLDESVAMSLIEFGDRQVVSNLAQKTSNKKVFLATLIHDDAVARSLSRNQDMCELLDVQQILVKHENPQVRLVAASQATNQEVLMLCVKDDDSDVLWHAGYNEALTDEHIKKLLERADSKTMSSLHSSHEKYLRKNLAECVANENEQVRAYVAENFKLTKAMTEKLVRDSDAAVRKAVLENYESKFSVEQIELLRNDESENVRRAVKWRFD